jgi:hypothetical protein
MTYFTYSTSISTTFISYLTASKRHISKVSGFHPRFGVGGILTPRNGKLYFGKLYHKISKFSHMFN